MDLLADFLLIGGVALLGAISPGPDFFVVTKNSLTHSRKAGLFTAFGVAVAILIHVTYCIVGLGVVIAEVPWIYQLIQYAGAAYLIYIGWQSFRSKSVEVKIGALQSDIPSWVAFKQGFLTNALNPKAALFFLSIFSQVISRGTSVYIQALFGLEISLITGIWFLVLAVVFSHAYLQTKVIKAQKTFDRIFGGALIALGLKIAFV